MTRFEKVISRSVFLIIALLIVGRITHIEQMSLFANTIFEISLAVLLICVAIGSFVFE